VRHQFREGDMSTQEHLALSLKVHKQPGEVAFCCSLPRVRTTETVQQVLGDLREKYLHKAIRTSLVGKPEL
jgi:hypothetical protein